MSYVSKFNVLGVEIDVKDTKAQNDIMLLKNQVDELIIDCVFENLNDVNISDKTKYIIVKNYREKDNTNIIYKVTNTRLKSSTEINEKFITPVSNNCVYDYIWHEHTLSELIALNPKKLFLTKEYTMSQTISVSDIDIEGGTFNLVGRNNTCNILTAFESNNCNYIHFKNCIFNGLDINATNIKVNENSAIECNNVYEVIVDSCSFNNINQYNADISPIFSLRKSCCVTTVDCMNVKIINSLFNEISGDEGIMVLVTNNRENSNLHIENNVFRNLKTSAYDFLGNDLLSKNNRYEFNYTGSCINGFGYNCKFIDEKMVGNFGSLIDTVEGDIFSSNSVLIDNIELKGEVKNAFELSGVNNTIRNIKNLKSTNVFVAYRINNIGDNIFTPIKDGKIIRGEVLLENCTLNDYKILLYCVNEIGSVISLQVNNCTVETSGIKDSSICGGNNVNFFMNNCTFSSRGTEPFLSYIRGYYFINNCRFLRASGQSSLYTNYINGTLLTTNTLLDGLSYPVTENIKQSNCI